ncbi:DUF397 domain-containing protein [Streptomyces sp. NBC_01465]|uniref:DUF397 domain-containing protein n=1 Tax=Streptomyces sp. NBC_01465 TaxID=2903878 RepID=UPI002E354832|nr:DUF397 domain-containing protein [Streptomyces sp. NBC_01465]
MTRVAPPDLSAAVWRKSSRSNTQGGDCVEVADGHPTLVPVRDSKRPHSPAIHIPAAAWTAFLDLIK